MTTAGSLRSCRLYRARRDSFVAQRLREAGAVILGKTNLSEWANFRSSHSTSGWSGRGGQTRNPYALDRNPCGSSSGSGAAVAANLCAVAVGTETDGSVVCPSSVERHGRHQADARPGQPLRHHPHRAQPGHSRPHAPHRRRCRDSSQRAGGHRSGDAATERARGKAQPDYTQFLDPNGLRGARIGVARKVFRLQRTGRRADDCGASTR